MSMVGKLYEWPAKDDGQKGVWPGGVWKVICRWGAPPYTRTFRCPETGQLHIGHPGQIGYSIHGPGKKVVTWKKLGVVRNVLVENVATGERKTRPWYPAPRKVAGA